MYQFGCQAERTPVSKPEFDGVAPHLSALGNSQDFDSRGLVYGQSVAALQAIRSCWAKDVYIDVLAWRFWRLTLQVCSFAMLQSRVLTFLV